MTLIEETTIAAIATPPGLGGIGLIKISGSNAFDIMNNIFIPKNKKIIKKKNKSYNIYFSNIDSHKLYYGHIIHPKNGKIVDEVLVAFMKAPNTYTTENIVEIQAHSGFINLNILLSIVLRQGAKLAKPGEFTKRAFLGGRIDLTQAEGIIDLINAKTNKSAEIAAKIIKGYTKTILKDLRTKLITIKYNLEAELEFSDQIDIHEERQSFINIFEIIKKEIIPNLNTMLIKEKDKIFYQHGVTATIIGSPNVGKSTLMNKLLGENRVIVSKIPGTTRDVIKEELIINQVPILLQDTAGIHKSKNIIEQIGIKKSKNLAKKSDIILIVIDVFSENTSIKKKIIDTFPKNKIIIVINKIDISTRKELELIENIFSDFESIKISAKKKMFIDDLKGMIFKKIINEKDNDSNFNSTALNYRHFSLLTKAKKNIISFVKQLKNNSPLEILSIEIDKSILALDLILGINKNENLYENIFSKFCIGK